MRNTEELRASLVDLFKGLKDGTVEPKLAAEMNNTAGKIISTVKLELDYMAITGKNTRMQFMEPSEPTIKAIE